MSQPQPPAKQVFISHAHDDNGFSRKLAESLSVAGLSVWFDVGNLKPGERLDEVITNALHASDAFVLVLTPAAVASQWVHAEWNEALERLNKGQLQRFIAIIAQDCDIPIRLKTLLYIDFANRSSDVATRELKAALGIHEAVVEIPKLWELKKTINTHVGIFGLSWSPDGKYIATGSHDKRARIWNAATLQCELTLSGHENWVDAVAWSPDGKRLASASEGQRIRLWDVASGQQQALLVGHTASVKDVSWSRDGRSLISCSDDMTIRVWDIASGNTRMMIKDLTKPLTSVAWSPDEKMIAASARDALIHIWDAQTGARIKQLAGHKDIAFYVRWSPNGRQIASSGHTTVRLWSWQYDQCLRIYEGHQGHVICVAWRPDGNIIASGSADHSLRLWSPEGDRITITPGMHTDWVHSVAWSPDGMLLASSSGINDGRIMLWGPA